jgi:hypothetical protein
MPPLYYTGKKGLEGKDDRDVSGERLYAGAGTVPPVLFGAEGDRSAYGERFPYTCSRGRRAVSDVIWGIKLRGVFFTPCYPRFNQPFCNLQK